MCQARGTDGTSGTDGDDGGGQGPRVGAGGPDVAGAAGAGVRRRKFVALSNDISPIFHQIERSNVVNLHPAMHSGVCFRRQIRQSTGVYAASTIVPWAGRSQ
jgi:hypothetical protein